jgi:hypothetical protein
MLDLSGLSDEALFGLREARDPAPLLAAQHDAAQVDAFAAALGPRDLFSLARVTLLRSLRFEGQGRDDKAQRVLSEYLGHYERYHPKLNMVAYLPLVVPIYARLGDLLLEKAQRPAEASDCYLRILGLGMLRKTSPFVMLVAASRIVRGATLRFLDVGDPRQVRHAQYGIALFRFAVECAYDSAATDFASHAIGPDRFDLPKPHFFRDIAKEAGIISEAMLQLDGRLAEPSRASPQGS